MPVVVRNSDVAKMGEREWYFFSLRDRKYPTGLRTNRATGSGYWKATGKDREVDSASSGLLLGMKKTLVFYKGRAPRGEKTKWVMHEYRLDGDFSYRHSCKEEWVICRIFHKNGEKRGQVYQGRSYLVEDDSSPKLNSLPPLLETPATALLDCQSQNFGHCFDPILDQESELKDHLFPMSYGFQFFHQPTFSSSPPSAVTPATNSPSSSIFKAALLSHQDYYLKEDFTVVQQCKTEPNFSHFRKSAADNGFLLVDKNGINPYDYEKQPLLFEMDCSAPGAYPAAAAAALASDTSTSIPFNTAGFQMMLDLPIKLPAESWSLDV